MLKMERQSCVGNMRNCKLVRPKEANNEGAGKEASATRVISQPQMLDKSKEAESLWDDIQKGWSDYLEEKSLPILSKVQEYSPDLLIQWSSNELLETCLRQRMHSEPQHT